MRLKDGKVYVTYKEDIGIDKCLEQNIDPDADFLEPALDSSLVERIYAVLDENYVTCFLARDKDSAEAFCYNANKHDERTFHVEEALVVDSVILKE